LRWSGWTIDQVSLTQVGEDKVIGSAHWPGVRGVPAESNRVVITFRDGKITDMQECASQREAERYASRH
jgi:hypothetical protein